MTDDTGTIQHAVEDVPNRETGYCTDDVARAWMVALRYLQLVPGDRDATRIAATSLAFLIDAQLLNGAFHNFMSYDRTWLEPVGSPDSNGRAVWSLGYGLRFAPRPSWRRICGTMLERALPAIEELAFIRSKAYAMLGLAHAVTAVPEAAVARALLGSLTRDLRGAYSRTRGSGWEWFEETMTYDNARLPEALLRAGIALGDEAAIADGLATLSFYLETTVENGVFVPVGSEGWYRRGGPRARFAQQPLEAAALVDAALAASEAGGDPAFADAARLGLAWFFGSNSTGAVPAEGGGCCDGLEETSVNRNMGAESTLAYLASAYAMAEARPEALFTPVANRRE